MAIPRKGDPFPDFVIDGFDTRVVRSEAPLVIIVWRIGCSTSRMALPFFDRLQGLYPEAKVLGICQDSGLDLVSYVREHGISFQQVSDSDLRISHLLGVDTVPSYWLVGAEGTVLQGGLGWDRQLVEGIGNAIAAQTGAEPQLLIKAEERVPAFTPG